MTTGLSGHVIRAWERRYQAVSPRRSRTGRRLYSRKDMERLTLLKRAIDSGHRISHVANLDRETLADLTHTGPVQPPGPQKSEPPPPRPEEAQTYIEECLQAIGALDAPALQDGLHRSGQAFGRRYTIEAVIRPVMTRVGQCWSEGSLRLVHEHFATAILHAHLCRMLDTPSTPVSHPPRLLIGTPAGQWCHLGALATAVIARDHGWEPVFLGPSLPAEEIAAACAALDPQMIALSITCRFDDACLQEEIHRLTALLENRCLLVLGGLAAERCRPYVETAEGVVCAKTDALISLLH
jgi:DNA-binding transcriptional MerR regulator/methylmalonyl-CoA mutase cobalamin-binding subunit